MKYELAIFDLDGTVLDTLDDLANAVNFALSEYGFPKRTTDEVRSFVGNGIKRLIELSVPTDTALQTVQCVTDTFMDYYMANCDVCTRAYDGINDMLKELREKGMRTAIVSNKSDYAVQKLCKKYFDSLFDFVLGSKEGMQKKPSPDMVNEALLVLCADKKNTVYIGDSDVDIKTARNSDIDCIAVDWGFRSLESLLEAGAKTIVSDIDSLFLRITE